MASSPTNDGTDDTRTIRPVYTDPWAQRFSALAELVRALTPVLSLFLVGGSAVGLGSLYLELKRGVEVKKIKLEEADFQQLAFLGEDVAQEAARLFGNVEFDWEEVKSPPEYVKWLRRGDCKNFEEFYSRHEKALMMFTSMTSSRPSPADGVSYKTLELKIDDDTVSYVNKKKTGEKTDVWTLGVNMRFPLDPKICKLPTELFRENSQFIKLFARFEVKYSGKGDASSVVASASSEWLVTGWSKPATGKSGRAIEVIKVFPCNDGTLVEPASTFPGSWDAIAEPSLDLPKMSNLTFDSKGGFVWAKDKDEKNHPDLSNLVAYVRAKYEGGVPVEFQVDYHLSKPPEGKTGKSYTQAQCCAELESFIKTQARRIESWTDKLNEIVRTPKTIRQLNADLCEAFAEEKFFPSQIFLTANVKK